MSIKGGAYPTTVFHTVKTLMLKGMTCSEAIAEVEQILRGQLPDHIKDQIRQEVL